MVRWKLLSIQKLPLVMFNTFHFPDFPDFPDLGALSLAWGVPRVPPLKSGKSGNQRWGVRWAQCPLEVFPDSSVSRVCPLKSGKSGNYWGVISLILHFTNPERGSFP